jgi:predicted DCC family thiol-disulfide oxidoreductase YuxK
MARIGSRSRIDGLASAAIAASRSTAACDRQSGTEGAPPWVVLYDAECGFCMWLLSALLRWDRALRLRPLALQRAEAQDLLADLTNEQRAESWHLISPSGERSSAGAAFPPVLRLLPGGKIPAAAIERVPALTARAYRLVADHRGQLARLVPPTSKQRAIEHVRTRERARP